MYHAGGPWQFYFSILCLFAWSLELPNQVERSRPLAQHWKKDDYFPFHGGSTKRYQTDDQRDKSDLLGVIAPHRCLYFLPDFGRLSRLCAWKAQVKESQRVT